MHDTRLKQLQNRIPEATVDHYAAIPWVQATLQDPSFTPVSASREVTHDGVGHTLMGKTWNTSTTIPHRLTLHRSGTSSSPLSHSRHESTRAEVRRLYTFGGDLNAHPNLLHGGVIGCLLDSSLGGAVALELTLTSEDAPIFTVQLNVSYRKPVATPGTVIVRSWVDRVEAEGGRKIWAKGVIEGEGGVIHAEGEGLWVKAKGPKL